MPPSVGAAFCPYCGKPVVAGGTFCPSCGATLGSPATGAVGTPPPSPFAPPPVGPVPPLGATYSMFGAPNPASLSLDRSALSSVQWAAVLALVGAFVSVVTLFAGNVGSLVTVTTTASGSSSLSLSAAALYFLAVTAGVGLVLTVLELILYRSAFRALAPIDDRFSTPATLVLLLFIAVILIVVIGAAVIGVALQAIACAGAGNPITSSCLSVGTLLDLVGLLAVVAIVALIGYIGLLIGIWRLGSRYNESLFKVGAILLIFPVLNFIGAILILVGARAALSRLGGPLGTPTFG